MKSLTPYEVSNRANMFRLFLRNTFYPSHIQEIKDNIVCYIPGCNNINSITYNDSNFEYNILSNEQEVKNVTFETYAFQVGLMLIRLFTASNDLVQLILHSNSKDKDLLFEIYSHIDTYKQISAYLSWLYACHVLSVDDNKRIITIYL